MEIIASRLQLPHDRVAACWEAIKIESSVRERLLAQAALALTIRRKLPFEVAPIHGLIILFGPPGTGKTTLARGLANEVAKSLKPEGALYIEVDPHAIASSSIGHSQTEVTRVFDETIPRLAAAGPLIVLLDEVETIVADRYRLSLEKNPIDVLRATDAAMVGLDRLCRQNPNVLLLATTNFPQALDTALLSRADLVEEIALPDTGAREKIIGEILEHLVRHWPGMEELRGFIPFFAEASQGVDGRRLRKAFIAAIASTLETARDPNKVTANHVVAALQSARVDVKDESGWHRQVAQILRRDGQHAADSPS